jgi:hypothetical protein
MQSCLMVPWSVDFDIFMHHISYYISKSKQMVVFQRISILLVIKKIYKNIFTLNVDATF